ncbi:MAG: ABC transporter ATP-binding protein [Duodenibacillus sp.]|nr:ABC transporter ATP-binding protein [Duodenibacillus sp.]
MASVCNVIECRDLVFKRGDRAYLQDVTFTLPEGRLMGLVGHNGAGKSTLLKVVLGLLKPFSGSVQVLGATPGTRPLEVGYLPENVSFYNHMTMAEHLAFFAGLKGVGRSRIDALVEELGIGRVLNTKLGQCSKGERQRLGLAQALLTEPRLLILDEPTVGLDPAASLLMYGELSKLRQQGCSVVVCTHELALVEPYLDCALVMSRARMRGFGTLDELRAAAELPVTILRVPEAVVTGDAELAVLREGDALRVPAARLEAVMQRLTQQHGCYGMEVRKAGLGDIFRRFVIESTQGEH